MRFSWAIWIALIFLGGIWLKAVNSGKAYLDGKSLEFSTYSQSLHGTYFLGLTDCSNAAKLPIRSQLLAVDQDGQIRFQRIFENLYQMMIPLDFKSIGAGQYGYFLGFFGYSKSWGTYHFLTSDFRELYARPLPNFDPDLDIHDVAPARDGGLFFMFSRQTNPASQIYTEIQEWNRNGQVIFSWLSKDYLTLPDDMPSSTIDPFHVNSVEQEPDGGLLLSLNGSSEIAKIDYPSGKVLWRISYRTWSFPNDPFNGFRLQHTVRRLPNGNILLYDNGDGSAGRPNRAVEYSLDMKARVATLVWEYRARPGEPFRSIGGSVQRLGNQHTVIGWGSPECNPYVAVPRDSTVPAHYSLPVFTEIDMQGRKVRELVADKPLVSYRVFFEETR